MVTTTSPSASQDAESAADAADARLPLDVHIFERNGRCYALDAKSLTVLALSRMAADVLALLPGEPLEGVVAQLAGRYPADDIRRAYRSFLRLMLDGHLQLAPVPRMELPGLQNIVLMLAGGCNMGCSYCFEHDAPSFQAPNLLSEETADQAIAWFMANHKGTFAHVEYYGGEPTLNWRMLPYTLEKLEAWASETGKTLTKYIITNGTLLSDDKIAYLKAHDVDIQVSLDGGTSTNRLRTFKNGAPTHAKVTDTIRRLNESGASYNVRAVLANSVADPESVIAELEGLGARIASFGTVSSNQPQFQWTEAQEQKLLDNYDAHIRRRGETANDWELPVNVQGIVGRLRRKARMHYACHAGTTEVTVSPDGSIYECQRLMGPPLGQLDDGRTFTEMNSAFLKPVDERADCHACFARYLCGGGCKESNVVHNGVDRPWPAFCAMKRMEVEAAVAFLADAQLSERGEN